mmetsp:Transcript_15670/g.23712  ORF Transcript_15670/g.23712 Transcript_15670/m.23712 type:complete len:481 (-) Transcript_15670:69-1511(-)
MRYAPDGPSVPLLPVGSVPYANPVTLSEDGNRLFYAQCWNVQDDNSLFELDLETSEVKLILKDIYGCASNAMAYKDNALFTPRPFEGRVVKIDLKSSPPQVTNVTTGMVAPNAVKFNSKHELFVVDDGAGEVALVNLTADHTDANRNVVARFPPRSIDNLAFDQDDRLFISSTAEASVTEVLSDGQLRIVSSEGMSMAMGLAGIEVDGTQKLYTLHPGALYEIDLNNDAKLSTIVRSAVSLGPMNEPTSIAVWGHDLILMSFTSNSLMIWDLESESSKLLLDFAAPTDAHPFNGDLLVTESSMGRIVRVSPTDSFRAHEVVVEAPGAAFLFMCGDDDDVYASDGSRGLVLQIISQQQVLDPPLEIASGLSFPEGIAMHHNGKELLVIEAGSDSLLAIDRTTGEKRLVATDLLLMPGVPMLPFGYPNNVVSLDGAIYANGDGANVIYLIQDEEEPTSNTYQNVAIKWHIIYLWGFFIYRAP